MDREEQQSKETFSLPSTSPADLRGRQSVRATFRLSTKAIDALSVVAVQLGIKQKSLFDHLIEDLTVLEKIAQEYNTRRFNNLSRIQKTFVLSRRTLSCLETVAGTFQAPRDALVEYSIRRLLPLIDQERDKHQKRKALLSELKNHLKAGQAILDKAQNQLGKDDPVVFKLESMLAACKVAHNQIALFIDRAKGIEQF